MQPNYFSGFRNLANELGKQSGDHNAVPADVTREAIENGAHPAALDVGGFSLLDLACFCGDRNLAEIVLNTGAPVAVLGPTKPSALMWAHWGGVEGTVMLLTSQNA